MKQLTSLVSAVLLLVPLSMPALAAANTCAMRYPTIGIIRSVASMTSGEYTQIDLANSFAFNDVSFGNESVNIDQYGALAASYVAHDFSLSPEYTRRKYDSESEITIASLTSNIVVDTAAIHDVAYAPGDIVIEGPPGGGMCNSYGFVGFFHSDGTLYAAIATTLYMPFSKAHEKLLLEPAADFACIVGSGEFPDTTCQRPIRYSSGINSKVVKPGETEGFAGSFFTSVHLLISYNITPPPNVMGGGFGPRLLQTFQFAGTVPTKSKQCPTLTRNLHRGSSGSDVQSLQTFLVTIGLLQSENVTAYFGARTEAAIQNWQVAHGVVTSGSPAMTGFGATGPKTRAALASCK